MCKMELSEIYARNNQTLDDRFNQLDGLEVRYFPFDSEVEVFDSKVFSQVREFLKSQRILQDPLSFVPEGNECGFIDCGYERVIGKAPYSGRDFGDVYQMARDLMEGWNLAVPEMGFHGDLCLIYGIPEDRMSQIPGGRRVYDSTAYLFVLPRVSEKNGNCSLQNGE